MKILKCIIIMLCMTITIAVLTYENSKIEENNYYAFYIGETPSDTAPASNSGYMFDHADCNNAANVVWDDVNWTAKVTNLTTSRTKCTLYFEEDRRAATAIKNAIGDADPTSTEEIDKGTDASGCTNTLAYDDFGNIRYTGANPCNYVTFNDETAGWRIIGVFDNQIKLIRNESIGDYSWDTSASNVNSRYGINQWGESGTYTGADLMKLLNPGYDNNLAEDASGNTITGTYVNNSLYWNKQSGNCYNNWKNAYTTCDFSTTGLTEAAKAMIDKHTWNLGSQGENDVWTTSGNGLASKFYEYERSNNNGKICSSGSFCNDTINRTTTWEGYVGLMSPSDYGYAVGGEARTNCLANTNLSNYNTNNCNTNDWLLNSTYPWTMSPAAYSSDADAVFYVYSDGNLNTAYAYAEKSVRPALFLKSSVERTGGNGTPTNPYTLSLD